MSQYTIGELVQIIEDCREGHVATGQIGTYEGRFRLPDSEWECPRIRLQDGSVIWGCDCWWAPARKAGPLPQMQAALEEHKAFLLKKFEEAGE